MKKRNYSVNIARKITCYLLSEEWVFFFDEKAGIFRLVFSPKGKIKKINFYIDIREHCYVVYAVSPVGADSDDEKQMAAVEEFVCRANNGQPNGNFELNMLDGEIRYKYFVDCDGIDLSDDMICKSIYYPMAMFECYGDGIINVIAGAATARKAVEYCEIMYFLRELAEDEGDDTIIDFADDLMDFIDDNSVGVRTDAEPVHIKTNRFFE